MPRRVNMFTKPWGQVLDIVEGQEYCTVYGHQGPVHSVKFSRRGDFFASAGADGQVLVRKALSPSLT